MENQQPEIVLPLKTGQKKTTKHNDWRALKIEFMQGPWEKASDFREDKGVLNNDYARFKMKGWQKAKKKAVDSATQAAFGEIEEMKPDEIHRIRKRQAEDARILQQKGFNALEVLEPKNSEDARKMIITGMQEERAALGISEKGGQPNLTQVNVNLPKTKFDKIISGQDFAGILRFIAELKRERARRSGTTASSTSKTASG